MARWSWHPDQARLLEMGRSFILDDWSKVAFTIQEWYDGSCSYDVMYSRMNTTA